MVGLEWGQTSAYLYLYPRGVVRKEAPLWSSCCYASQGAALGGVCLTSGLIMQVSDEAERSVLVKLKTECGYQFTSKLESMFTDIKTSRDTMQEYKARRQAAASSAGAADEDVELSVQVGAACTASFHSIVSKRLPVRMLILILSGRCCLS